jgi:Chromo (CHRromatin Organisation MOdifier) domain
MATAVHNNTKNSTTGFAPNTLLLGWEPPLAPDQTQTSSNQKAEDYVAKFQKNRLLAILALNKAASAHAPVASKYTQGQRVWLEGKNLPISHGTIKLSPKQYGLFSIAKLISLVASQLDLPVSWNIHPIFHNSLLTPYIETNAHGPNFTRPPPDLINGEAEYEVEAIRSHCYFGKNKKLQYLLKWKGYPEADNTWESKHQLKAPDLLKQYNRCHNINGIKTRVELAETHPPSTPQSWSSIPTLISHTESIPTTPSSINAYRQSTYPMSLPPLLCRPRLASLSRSTPLPTPPKSPNSHPTTPPSHHRLQSTSSPRSLTSTRWSVRLLTGLVSTVHRREVAHALKTKECNETNRILQEKLKKYADKIDKEFFLPGCPDGYEPNDRRISTLIPVGEGFFVPAKFVKLRDDGRVLCLPGKEHHKDAYTTELFLSPDYSSQDVAEPIPIWFNTLLNGPTPAYHTLRRAIADLDDWNATAEVERYRRQDD